MESYQVVIFVGSEIRVSHRMSKDAADSLASLISENFDEIDVTSSPSD